MNEVLYGLGWVLKGIEVFVLAFIIFKFYQLRWKLFFGGRKDLPTIQHHELHSCFLSALCVLIFHVVNSEISLYILSIEMNKLEQIKLFYLSKAIVQFSFAATLFFLHLLRGCTFSKTARICMYTTLILMLMQGMQLTARGYFDYHELKIIYVTVGWICNIIIISAIAAYPLKSLKLYIKQKRATE
ncbi:hypothetical protein HG263_12025 [Pseudoalteromonas sp. JBTF-M23]|uniref:Uncharacterized protein n=1 Tax=Pseudoalteromonas caenipelagi TaxID=2726988 RepID=A0A849VDR7_9GAMM|nr:hypothetical protein [Pseudoalteromonas caenipelagi]NOU51255.1 hypothetical protein [Pseudoalteromonas caenipelagi]